MIRKSLLGLLTLLLLLVAVLIVNTLRYVSKQVPIAVIETPTASPDAISRFQAAIKIQTISYGDHTRVDSGQFFALHNHLAAAYPNAAKQLTKEVIAGLSLLFRWEGKNPELKPVILMAHQDVVPIEEATRARWSVDPFGGELKNDSIWGRGTVDDKINLVSIMEAVESLIAKGFQPERTIYLAFGHDEEVGGTGAKGIAALLQSRGIVAEMVLDEGGIITSDKIPGMTKPVALIGTSEKGYLSIDLVAEKNGGHSSQPETETSIDILAKAIQKIRQSPFEANFSESTQGFLNHLGPEMPFVTRIFFANQWLFKSVIIAQYEKSPGGNALMRTTAVPTIINAGIKDNVIPTAARATVNFRLLPGDESTEVIERVKMLVDDPRVRLETRQEFISEASEVTAESSFGYKKVDETIHKVSANTVTAPFLMIGGTDSRHFGQVSSSIIKFSPMADPIGFHGINERISVSSYALAIHFYNQLILGL